MTDCSEGRVTICGACLKPVIHGPEQCIVMRMYVERPADKGTDR
jgi:hypothetical protein